MYVQLSIDNGIGTGALAGGTMSPWRYAAFKDMARELLEEFASANGWIDTSVEVHEFHDASRGFTSTKVSAYATERSADYRDFDLRGRVATLAWQFSQESIHVVAQGFGLGAIVELVYGKDAAQARRRETYIEKQGGHNPWEVKKSEPSEDVVATGITRLRETLEEVVKEFEALAERQEKKEEPEPLEIKVDADTVAKARRIAQRALSEPDADEMTLDIFGKALSLPAELSDGFTIVRSTTD